MSGLAQKYKIPTEVMAFVNEGILKLAGEDEANKTVEFHIPAMRWRDRAGHITSYSVIWIHPDFNAEFCRYYAENPGDLPNFYAEKDTTDVGSDRVDGLESVDDFVAWLEGILEDANQGVIRHTC